LNQAADAQLAYSEEKYVQIMVGCQMPVAGYCIHHKDSQENVQSLLSFRQFSPCDIEKAPVLRGLECFD
jgi:hypothetical protein